MYSAGPLPILDCYHSPRAGVNIDLTPLSGYTVAMNSVPSLRALAAAGAFAHAVAVSAAYPGTYEWVPSLLAFALLALGAIRAGRLVSTATAAVACGLLAFGAVADIVEAQPAAILATAAATLTVATLVEGRGRRRSPGGSRPCRCTRHRDRGGSCS